MPRLPIVGRSVNQNVTELGQRSRQTTTERISGRTQNLPNVPRRVKESGGEFKQRLMQRMQSANEAGGRG